MLTCAQFWWRHAMFKGMSRASVSSPDWIFDVTKNANGCGECTSHAMNSGVPQQSSWQTTDAQDWWLRTLYTITALIIYMYICKWLSFFFKSFYFWVRFIYIYLYLYSKLEPAIVKPCNCIIWPSHVKFLIAGKDAVYLQVSVSN